MPTPFRSIVHHILEFFSFLEYSTCPQVTKFCPKLGKALKPTYFMITYKTQNIRNHDGALNAGVYSICERVCLLVWPSQAPGLPLSSLCCLRFVLISLHSPPPPPKSHPLLKSAQNSQKHETCTFRDHTKKHQK